MISDLDNDTRYQEMMAWLETVFKGKTFELSIASADASFRRYFRLHVDKKTWIVMDAPPEKESCTEFVALSKYLLSSGMHVPEVIEENVARGFLLLTDLGEQPYLQVLNDRNVEGLYGDAMSALLSLQTGNINDYNFPRYDKNLLMNEMALFSDWLLKLQFEYELSEQDSQQVLHAYQFLTASALEQPQVAVHRDYHSRNLMVAENNNPGILDFQDAVLGPVTYDLVSLLKDCYIRWPREWVEKWVAGYHHQAMKSGILHDVTEQQFLDWFHLMGVQRHLKAAGIFARLNIRDSKSTYLGDIPRTLGYISEIAPEYPQLQIFQSLLTKLAPQIKSLSG